MAAAVVTVPPGVEEREDYVAALRDAISLVITDDGFSIPSPLAQNARQCAEKLLEFISDKENRASVYSFTSVLIGWLKGCLKEYKSIQVTREKMWEKFFHLRSDEKYREHWNRFLNDSISIRACPIFYQFVTDSLMKTLMKSHFSLASSSSGDEPSVPALNYRETNIIRYMIGSVIRALKKKVKKSGHPLKEELGLCLVDMEEESGCDDDESTEWTEVIDRGGLIHVSHNMYMLFVSMEMELRRYLLPGASPELELVAKSKDVEESDDVQFYWSTVSANWGETEAAVLLNMMVEHYITVRGFYFTAGVVERQKKEHKKSLQKSKGLRKKLMNKTQTDDKD